VCTVADLTPLVQNEDAAGIHDGGHALRDDDGRRILVIKGERFSQGRVSTIVKR
jgi:hypothetical protein